MFGSELNMFHPLKLIEVYSVLNWFIIFLETVLVILFPVVITNGILYGLVT